MLKWFMEIVTHRTTTHHKHIIHQQHCRLRKLQWQLAESEAKRKLCDRSRLQLQKAALLTKAKTPGIDPGYVHIEVSDLVMWLVRKNGGLEKVIAQAVGELAQQRFMEVLAI